MWVKGLTGRYILLTLLTLNFYDWIYCCTFSGWMRSMHIFCFIYVWLQTDGLTLCQTHTMHASQSNAPDIVDQCLMTNKERQKCAHKHPITWPMTPPPCRKDHFWCVLTESLYSNRLLITNTIRETNLLLHLQNIPCWTDKHFWCAIFFHCFDCEMHVTNQTQRDEFTTPPQRHPTTEAAEFHSPDGTIIWEALLAGGPIKLHPTSKGK